MVKLRSAFYCNLKLLLIFLVVYGHLIEPNIWNSELLMQQYRWIYLVHMPLFSFLSGLFAKTPESCKRQFLRMMGLYWLLQLCAVALGKGQVRFLTPYWHLWYLLSSGFWYGITWLWFRFGKGRGGAVILFVSIVIGCLAGYWDAIGRVLSASRTIVFFPYFWLGVLCDGDYPWRKLRPAGFAALLAAIWLMTRTGGRISAVFLYQAAPFGTPQQGAALRLLCYALGGLLGFFLLTITPDRRFFFTRAGADTMPAYLLHAPAVLYLRMLPLPAALLPIAAAAVLYCIHRIFRWQSLYGITQKERRDLQWPLSKRSTRNTRKKYINSC